MSTNTCPVIGWANEIESTFEILSRRTKNNPALIGEPGVGKTELAKALVWVMFGEEFWVEKNAVEFMRIYGNFTEHDYQFEIDGALVASVHKKWVAL